jgi:hypothetical protein
MAVSTDGAIAVLSVEGGRIAVIDDALVRVITLRDSIVPVGLRFVDDEARSIEVLDRGRRTLLRYDGETLVREVPFPAPIGTTHAVAASRGWFVVGAWSGDLEVYWLRDGAWRYLTGMPLGDTDPTDYHLGRVADRAVLTFNKAPFHVLVVDTTGEVVFCSIGERQWLSAPRRAFPALYVGRHTVQVVADLQADEYRIGIYDSIGHLMRRKTLPGPLSLVASVPGRNELIGFTNLRGNPVISIYEWQSNLSSDGRDGQPTSFGNSSCRVS